MTILQPGDLMIRKEKEEEYLAISGGFLEVRPDKVIILADACERLDEIDIARAEEAKKRAQETMKAAPLTAEAAVAEAALRRSLARLKVAERKRRKPPGPV
jgi:F-type H+-transporting ATPase subunit epsilon